jgi:hypothetical protein
MSSNSIRDVSLWQRFVADGSVKQKTDIRDELAASVTDPQIAELIEISASGSALEAEAAIRVLMPLPRDRVSDAQRDTWAVGLLDIVRKHYPRDGLGIVAHSALRTISPNASEQFLLSELDLAGVRESDLRWVISALEVNGSAGALARLETLAQHNDDARKAWERLAGISRAELERLAREWRETRRTNVLDELWWKHISRLREGASATALMKLLGEPSRREGGCYWYEPADSATSLFLEADDRGGLVSWKLGG